MQFGNSWPYCVSLWADRFQGKPLTTKETLTLNPESLNQVMRTFLGSGNLACSRVEEANGVKLPIHKEEEVVGTLFKTLKQI